MPANIDIDATDDVNNGDSPAAGDISGSYTAGFSVDNVDYANISNLPANLDTDATDDFDGAYSSLTGVPANIDEDATDDITTANIGSLTANISTTGTLGAGATTVSSLTVSNLGTPSGDVAGGSILSISAGGVFSSSDERLKENITLLQSTLEKLDELGGYNYNYKADDEKKKQIGVIAQELEVVFPELVDTDDRGFKLVNYQGLIPVLIQAIKEQQLEINELTEKVTSQESKLSELESDNKEMKSDLDLIKRMLMGTETAKEDNE